MFNSLLGNPGNGRGFSKIERAILDAVGKLLEQPYSSVYKEQLLLVNEIQRHSNDKECNFYTLRLYKPVPLPKNLKLPQLAIEYPLARVTLQKADGRGKVRATVSVIEGRVFCITFDKAPNSLGDDFKIDEAVLLNGPGADKIATAIPENVILPAEYLELVKQGQNQINGWHLLPENEIREVVQEQDNLYVFAEREGLGVVCIRAGDKAGRPVFVNFEEREETDIDNSLTAFFSQTK